MLLKYTPLPGMEMTCHFFCPGIKESFELLKYTLLPGLKMIRRILFLSGIKESEDNLSQIRAIH
jgi:hypothetical protein